jgi:hypothetical protein
MKKLLAGLGLGLATSVALAGTAFANDCANLSRTPPPCYTAPGGCTTPVFDGHWAFLPSLEGPSAPPIWVFSAPENFTNGKTDALTAQGNISSGGAVCATPNRQFDPTLQGVHGVLSSEQCWFG